MNSIGSKDSDQVASPTPWGAVWASGTEPLTSLREVSPAAPFWRGLRARRGEPLSTTTSSPRLTSALTT
ncbi:hypothetical protein TSUD_185100 [Trifolium subterraneum]|uniref:Uncharacterized protein n=1 Tax=Trifolium subterraneum TaxID=3900 RepID=A0A2Z6PGW2_TRISU|nr:hypothetical protein TSUD_185100 [Trifolium subterraneum]